MFNLYFYCGWNCSLICDTKNVIVAFFNSFIDWIIHLYLLKNNRLLWREDRGQTGAALGLLQREVGSSVVADYIMHSGWEWGWWMDPDWRSHRGLWSRMLEEVCGVPEGSTVGQRGERGKKELPLINLPPPATSPLCLLSSLYSSCHPSSTPSS